MISSDQRAERGDLRQAAERLLAWGFPAGAIAKQLGCSTSWVYEIKRQRSTLHDDLVDAGSLLHLLGESHT